MLRLHTVSAGRVTTRYVRERTSRSKCWILHDPDILGKILYPQGCSSCLEQLEQRKGVEDGIDVRQGPVPH